MATETTNFNLKKPDRTDFVNITEQLNDNLDIIDAEIKEAQEKAEQAFRSANNNNPGNFKTFTSLAQIGLTEGTETMQAIGQALPNNSMLVWRKNTTNSSKDYPMSAGILTVTRISQYRIKFDFVNGSTGANAKRYFAYGDDNITPWFTGWKRILADSDLANIDKVNGHTVESDVPPNAKFTDTVYTHPSTHPTTILANGTLATGVVATNSTDYTTSRLRNIQASTTDLTAGTSTLANGAIYIVYE